jgi:hypothetical protein
LPASTSSLFGHDLHSNREDLRSVPSVMDSAYIAATAGEACISGGSRFQTEITLLVTPLLPAKRSSAMKVASVDEPPHSPVKSCSNYN